MLKKNTSILWALTDSGIVLQDLNNNVFYELDLIQEKIWSYADGTFNRKGIVEKLNAEFLSLSEINILKRVDETITLLLEKGLIKEE